jgi:hypothetical protein
VWILGGKDQFLTLMPGETHPRRASIPVMGMGKGRDPAAMINGAEIFASPYFQILDGKPSNQRRR